LHTAQLMPLPLTVSCFSKIQIGFTFLVPADPGSPGQRAVKRVCVCVVSALYCLILPRAPRTIVIPLAYTDDKYCHPASSSVDRLNLPNSHRQRPRNLSTKSAFSGNFFTFISLFAVLAVVMTRSSAIADGPRDALRWSKFCQLL